MKIKKRLFYFILFIIVINFPIKSFSITANKIVSLGMTWLSQRSSDHLINLNFKDVACLNFHQIDNHLLGSLYGY